MQSLEAFTRRDPGRVPPDADGSRLSRGLGLFSLGLGLTEIAAPRTLARAIGVDPEGRTSTALRIFGMREVLAGLGVMLKPRSSLPLWARVAGDALDLGAIAWAARSKRTSTERLAAAFIAVAGVAALDVIAGRRVAQAHRTVVDPVIFSVTINRSPAKVYAFWRKLENLPQFMDYLTSVTQRTAGRSHWVAKLPVGGTIAWDAEIIEDRPNELIAWRTVEGSPLQHRGEVTFARTPGRDMTEVRVKLELGLLGAPASPVLAKLLTKPQIKGDLRRLKQVLETGEVVRSDASIHRRPHPAQPSSYAPEPASRSAGPGQPSSQSMGHASSQSLGQSPSQSVRTASSQSPSQSPSQSVGQTGGQSAGQSSGQSAGQTGGQSSGLPSNQPGSQSAGPTVKGRVP
jgi:uncharacterized membrane protein